MRQLIERLRTLGEMTNAEADKLEKDGFDLRKWVKISGWKPEDAEPSSTLIESPDGYWFLYGELVIDAEEVEIALVAHVDKFSLAQQKVMKSKGMKIDKGRDSLASKSVKVGDVRDVKKVGSTIKKVVKEMAAIVKAVEKAK